MESAIISAGKAHDWEIIPEPQLSESTRQRLAAAMPGVQSGLERHEWVLVVCLAEADSPAVASLAAWLVSFCQFWLFCHLGAGLALSGTGSGVMMTGGNPLPSAIYVRIAAMSGPGSMIFITRVRL
jgi:hypothetical protein